MSNQYDLSQVLPALIKFRQERDWEQFHKPKELATAIGIEASELQELFLWREKESPKEIKTDRERYMKIQEEIADIAIYLLFICNDLGIELVNAINHKLKENERKYPKDIFRSRFE